MLMRVDIICIWQQLLGCHVGGRLNTLSNGLQARKLLPLSHCRWQITESILCDNYFVASVDIESVSSKPL